MSPRQDPAPTAGDPPAAPARGRMAGLRVLLGLLLAGHGALVLVGVIAHEAKVAGAASLLLGILLLSFGIPRLHLRRPAFVAAVGAVAAGGVLVHAAATGSGLTLAEAAILAYGVALLVAARHLDRPLRRPFRRTDVPETPGTRPKVGADVGTLVAWSFPLLLAPLALYALNAAFSGSAGAAATPAVAKAVVLPTAWSLRFLGTPVEIDGNNLLLATPRGKLVLGVGLVCAGIYPMVLFLGLVLLHAWRHQLAPPRIATLAAAGLALLWAVNILRLVALTRIGVRWGPEALTTAHAHAGWLLFALAMVAFWAVAFRRTEVVARPAAAAK
jgi:exosortase/archaeosortase family protein